MELVKKDIKIKGQSHYYSLFDIALLPLLGCGFILMEKAFLFNPWILLIFVVAYERSSHAYLLSTLSMITVAWISHISYGLEITLISIVYFFLTFNFKRIKFKNQDKCRFYPLIVIGIMLLIVNFIKAPSITTIAYGLISILITAMASFHILQFLKSVDDDSETPSLFNNLFFLLAFFYSSMCWPVFGLIMVRLLILNLNKDKKDLASLFLALVALSLNYIYHLSFSYIVMIILPLLISIIFQKKYVMYGISLVLISWSLDPLFYLNGLFYQGLLTLLLCFLIEQNKMSFFFNWLNKENISPPLLALESRKNNSNKVQAIIDYVDALNFELNGDSVTPQEKARHRVYAEVCSRCEHLLYCPLTNSLMSLLGKKITHENKQRINRECIRPYKLTLAIQQAYAIYLTEDGYYLESQKRKEMLRDLLIKIKEPLITLQNDYKKPYLLKEMLVTKALEKDIHISNVSFYKEHIMICSPYLITDIDYLSSLLYYYTGLIFTYERQNKSLFHNNYQIYFSLLKEHAITHTIHQKAVLEEQSGDYYLVERNNAKMTILLCDGMGHDKKAAHTSLSLASSFMALYRQNRDILSCINDVNSLFRVSVNDDNYATFDFCEIQCQTLECKFYKGGASVTLIIRNNEVITIPVGGLPIGLLDDIDIDIHSMQLQENDYLIFISDGLADFLISQDPHIFYDIQDTDNFFRHLFQIGLEKMKHSDDATMIICHVL